MDIKALLNEAHARDTVSWIAHGVIGFVLTAVFGLAFMAGAFVYREVSDLLAWWLDSRPAAPTDQIYRHTGGIWKRPLGSKLKDGFMDLWAPLAGAALALMLFG